MKKVIFVCFDINFQSVKNEITIAKMKLLPQKLNYYKRKNEITSTKLK